MDSDSCASPPAPPPPEDSSPGCGRRRTAEDFGRFCSFVLAYAGYVPCAQEECPLRSSPSPPNSTGGTIDSDGEPRFDHLPPASSLPGGPRKGSGRLQPGKPFSALYQWAEPHGGGPLAQKGRRKRKVARREVPALPREEGYAEAPGSPLSEGDAHSMGRCSAWDSDTPSNASYPPTAQEEEEGLIQRVVKRTVVRQGKQVVFRDEDGSADDEDIMVDSDDDSWDLVTCFCRKPFAGRPMIECNECHTWVHLSCAKIRKAHVPEVFVCQKCRDSKFDIRRSNRSRLDSRRRFVD